MSVTQYERLCSDKARIGRLVDELERWERNLRSARSDIDETGGRTLTIGEAHQWKIDAEIDLINCVRDAIDR